MTPIFWIDIPSLNNIHCRNINSDDYGVTAIMTNHESKNKKHKIIITGTGRTGTTFLVQLLTSLGLDTGFTKINEKMYDNCNAGMESIITDPDAPYIVKNPFLCDELEDVMETGQYVIDHAFIPVRNLNDAAASRIAVSKKKSPLSILFGNKKLRQVPGGLIHTEKPSELKNVLTRQLYNLIYVITVYGIPHTFMEFPRLATDSSYLYLKISPVFSNIDHVDFKKAFNEVSNSNIINNFK